LFRSYLPGWCGIRWASSSPVRARAALAGVPRTVGASQLSYACSPRVVLDGVATPRRRLERGPVAGRDRDRAVLPAVGVVDPQPPRAVARLRRRLHDHVLGLALFDVPDAAVGSVRPRLPTSALDPCRDLVAARVERHPDQQRVTVAALRVGEERGAGQRPLAPFDYG